MAEARFGNRKVSLGIATAALIASAAAGAQPSVGRGARDPVQATVIVGSEGKGLFVGAGIPDGNMPIFAAQNGAVPAGIEPLPHDIFTTRTSTRTAPSGPTRATTAAIPRSGSSRSGARTRCR
jgi:hypothetical protein